MKKIIVFILLGSMTCSLFGCKTEEIKQGMYINGDVGPYISLETNGKFHAGQGIAFSFAIGGKYEVIGNKLHLHFDDGFEYVLLIQKDRLKMVSCDGDFYIGNKGTVFKLCPISA